MKIVLLLDTMAWAGTERHVFDLHASLLAQGIDSTIACPRHSALAINCVQAGFPILLLKRTAIARIVQLRTLLSNNDANIIHAHNGRTAWLAALARLLAKCGKLITTMHFIDPARIQRRGLARMLGGFVHGFTKKQLSALIAISDAVNKQAVQRGDLPASMIHRVYNGVPQPAVNRDRDQIRKELGIDPFTTVFLAATRLQKEKAVGLLIDAADTLAKRSEARFQVLIVGRGRYQQELQQQIDQAGLGDRVQLLGFRQDVYDLMFACDVLIHPAPAEPFGLVLAEAMALGRPVIASSGGAAPEIVEDGESGLIFKAGDTEDLYRAVCRFLDESAAQRSAWGANARQRYLSHFTADRMARQTADVYQSVLRPVPEYAQAGAE